jgi:quinol monooxygenase YgiN
VLDNRHPEAAEPQADGTVFSQRPETACSPIVGRECVYGLIGKITAVSGARDRLAEILAGMGPMPGCRSYIVALDSSDDDALWVTEAWESADAHQNSMNLPQVHAAIAEGRPLIAGFDLRFETVPIGGFGL